MQVKATAAETDSVRGALEQDPDVDKVTFLSHRDAYNEFKRLFADQPELIQSESPDGSGLPESFELVLGAGASASAVTTRYETAPGRRHGDHAEPNRFTRPAVRVVAPLPLSELA